LFQELQKSIKKSFLTVTSSMKRCDKGLHGLEARPSASFTRMDVTARDVDKKGSVVRRR